MGLVRASARVLLVGLVRREGLEQVIVFGERLRLRILKPCSACYHESRTHLSLGKEAPEPRAERTPPVGEIVQLPSLAGLRHRYARKAG